MQSSTTAPFWAVPKRDNLTIQCKNNVKKSVHNVVTCAISEGQRQAPIGTTPPSDSAPPRRLIPEFVVEKQKRIGYFIDSPLGLLAEHQRVLTMLTATELQSLSFEEAAKHWLELKRLHCEAKTIKSYRDYLHRAGFAFAGMKLKEIHIGHFEEYQRRNRITYHPTAVNHDLNAVSQILRKANLWKAVEEHYHPLKVPKWQPPKVLTEEQEDAFFKLAASNPEWNLAYWVASLTNNTSAHGKELRVLQLKHICLEEDPPLVYIPDGKNDYRPRAIPLNEVGVKQIKRLLARAASLGATQPDHFVFPFRVKRNMFDPTRCASESWLKKRWKKLVDKAVEINPETGKPTVPFRIKPGNLRHQIITKLLEAGTPEHTTMAIVGHARREMLDYYSKTRINAKKAALSAIMPGKRGASA